MEVIRRPAKASVARQAFCCISTWKTHHPEHARTAFLTLKYQARSFSIVNCAKLDRWTACNEAGRQRGLASGKPSRQMPSSPAITKEWLQLSNSCGTAPGRQAILSGLTRVCSGKMSSRARQACPSRAG